MLSHPKLAALLATLAAYAPARGGEVVSTPAPPRLECGVILRPPSGLGWMEVDTGGESTTFITLAEPTEIVWHLDRRVHLPASELRPGTRIRFVCPLSIAERIEVVSLGPLAMSVAVEEFVADTCGGRPWRGLSAPEVATIEALGSPSHLVRESVSRAVRERGPRALRVLCWARRHADPEVRARAETILHDLGWERPGPRDPREASAAMP